jgi:hypothetical protein
MHRLLVILHQEAVTSIDVVNFLQVNLFIREIATFGIIVLVKLTLILKVIVLDNFLNERFFFNFWDSHVIIKELQGIIEETRE